MSARRRPAQPFDLSSFLPHKLSVLSRLTQGLLAAALDKSGVTVAQWRVYLCLARQGPGHLNGIAAFTYLPQSSLSRSIAQMAERGLVRNARKPSDRRISRIELTPAGRRFFEQLTGVIDDACRDAFQMQPAEEVEFIRSLDELISRLSSRLSQVPGPVPEPMPPVRSGVATAFHETVSAPAKSNRRVNGSKHPAASR